MTEREAGFGVAALANYGFDAGIVRGNPYDFGADVVRKYYLQFGVAQEAWDDEPRTVYLSDLDGVVEFLDGYRKSGGKKL